MSKKSRRKSNSVLMRFIKRSLKVIVFIGVPVLLFGFTFQLKNITVTGTSRYTSDQITEQVIKSKLDSNTLLLHLKYKYLTDVKIPFVEKVDLEIVDKNTINIQVYEKMVTGCVEFMNQYLYFDKDGIIVESSPTLLEDIPQVKGLRFNKIILYEKLEVQKKELFDVILNLTQQIDKYGLKVLSIRFNSDYEVMVDCGKYIALLGKRSTYDEVLSELSNIIETAEDVSDNILRESEGTQWELDMTNYSKDTEKIVAKPKKPEE
ncbi:MAG TPA: hypothetical protein VJZ06_10395 [Mobilitalea sp.]|nr:hypothetical protein [Mobilitalea sp.]